MNRNGNPTSLDLDAMTASLLVRLADTWGVSEKEAVRRALKQADLATRTSNKEDRLAAFKGLQRSLDLTSAKAAAWQDAIREARR